MILNGILAGSRKYVWKFDSSINIRILKAASDKLFKLEAYKTNENLELLYVKNGSLNIFNSGKKATASTGDLVVFTQGTVRSIDNEDDLSARFYFISAKGLYLETDPSQDIILKIQLGDCSSIAEQSCEILLKSVLNPQERSEDIAKSALYILSCLFTDNSKQLTTEKKKPFESDDTRLTKRILAYIDENYMRPLTIKSIADHFYISPSYMSHLMKRETGYSPIDYLIRRRIGESQQLLQYTGLKIGEIAKRVGYANLNNFSYLFKKNTNMSPEKFRQEIQSSVI